MAWDAIDINKILLLNDKNFNEYYVMARKAKLNLFIHSIKSIINVKIPFPNGFRYNTVMSIAIKISLFVFITILITYDIIILSLHFISTSNNVPLFLYLYPILILLLIVYS